SGSRTASGESLWFENPCVNRSSLSKASYPTCTKHVKKTTAHRWVGQEDICNSLGRLNDPGKPPLRRLGILPRQLRLSPLFLSRLPWPRRPTNRLTPIIRVFATEGANRNRSPGRSAPGRGVGPASGSAGSGCCRRFGSG